jgi:hypothetical protein
MCEGTDLPVKAPIYETPVVAPVYNWTGFYVGVNNGGSWGRSNQDVGRAGGPGAHNGLKSDVARCPKSAKTGLMHCDKRRLFDYCVGTAEQCPR